MKHTPLQLFNLKPDEAGVAVAKLSSLENYSNVYIVAVDYDSVVSRNMSVKSILNTQAQIQTKDLTYKKKAAAEKQGMVLQKQAFVLPAGQSITIDDISSTKLEIIDSISKAFKLLDQFTTPAPYGFAPFIKQILIDWPTF